MKKTSILAIAFLLASPSSEQDNRAVSKHCIDTPIEVIDAMMREYFAKEGYDTIIDTYMEYAEKFAPKPNSWSRAAEEWSTKKENLTIGALEAYDAITVEFGAKDMLQKINLSHPEPATIEALSIIASVLIDGADPHDHLGLNCPG